MAEQTTASYQCPSCGGEMAFDGSDQVLRCSYCQHEIAIGKKDEAVLEKNFEAYMDAHMAKEEHKVLTCKHCGASSTISGDDHGTFCPYCGSNHILIEQRENQLLPEYVVPFQIDKEKGRKLFKNWISKKFFAPKEIKARQKISPLEGIYLPYWTYDANTYSLYKAQRGDHYYVTRTRTVNGKTETYQERKTRWRWVSGSLEALHDDYLIKGTRKLDDKLMSQITPFHLEELTPYDDRYLAGYSAKLCEVDVNAGWSEAKVLVDQEVERQVRWKIGGDEVRFLSIDTSYSNMTCKHIFLPVYLSSYPFKEKLYQFMINGQTGEVVGQYPKSVIKIALTVLGVMGLVGLIYLLIQMS